MLDGTSSSFKEPKRGQSEFTFAMDFICKVSGPVQTQLLPGFEATEMQRGPESTTLAHAKLPGDMVSASHECKRDQRFTLLVVLETKREMSLDEYREIQSLRLLHRSSHPHNDRISAGIWYVAGTAAAEQDGHTGHARRGGARDDRGPGYGRERSCPWWFLRPPRSPRRTRPRWFSFCLSPN